MAGFTGARYIRRTNVAVFDRLAYLDALKAGGVTEEHARAHASALDAALRDSVATKDDLAREIGGVRQELASLRTELKGDIAALRTELKGEIAALRTELKGDTATLRAELKGEIERQGARLEARIADVRPEVFKWVVPLLLGQAALIVTLVKLL